MLLALPMAMIGVPIYLHIPQLFSDAYSVSLSLLGVVLLATRMIDTLSDPLLGALADRLRARGISYVVQIFCVMPIFLLALWMLVSAPMLAPWLWLSISLSLLYLCISALVVNYYALGIELAPDDAGQRKLTLAREGCMLLGIGLGSLLPAVLMQRYGTLEGMRMMAEGVIMLSAVVMIVAALNLPLRTGGRSVQRASSASIFQGMKMLFASTSLRGIALCYGVNALANAIPATLIFFYMKDVIGLSPAHQGAVLACYFFTGVMTMPFWNILCARLKAARCWMISACLAALAFLPAALLSTGDVVAFGIICALTGACLGADMAMPAKLTSEVIARESLDSATCFGVYHFIAKLMLALAAGVCLPLLDWLAHDPKPLHDQGVTSLALMYALLPALIKGCAVYLMRRHLHTNMEHV